MKTVELLTAAVFVAGATFIVSHLLAPKIEQAEVDASGNIAPEPVRADTQAAPVVPAANAALLKLEPDGHYWANADVDGRAIRFMVDTGASTVALTYEDARRIGLDPDRLDYSWTIRTAGGEVFGASVQLESIRIGRVKVKNVEAMVLREGLSQSLLGMTFLSQLDSYEFRKSHLILRQ